MLLPRRVPATPEEIEAVMTRYPGTDQGQVAGLAGILDFAALWLGVLSDWLESRGLSTGRFMALIVLTIVGEDGLAPSEIARRVRVTRATVTGLIDGLEAEGYVERAPSLEDRRRITIHLTVEGRALMEELLPAHLHRISQVMKGLTSQDLQDLRRLADRMRARTEELADA